MICYFREDFKPSIKIKMEQQDQRSMSFKKMVQKAVNREIKTGLRSSITIRDLDIHCFKGYRSSNSAFIVLKVLTQGTTAKKSCSKESRPKKTKSTNRNAIILPRTNVVKSLKQNKKDKKYKKQKFWEHRWDHTGELKKQTLIISVNTIKAGSKKKYPDIIYYNCNKKDHYSKSYPEPLKN